MTYHDALSLKNFENIDQNFSVFENYILNYGSYLEEVIKVLGNRTRITVSNSSRQLKEEIKISRLYPKCFLEEYKPIKTPPDGSCLWHSISICLSGDTSFTVILRLLTVYYLLKNKTRYKKFLENDLNHNVDLCRGMNSSEKNIYN